MIFLYCYMTAVFVVILLVTGMECAGLRNGVSGANGFVWLMVSIFMGVVLLPVTALAWFFGDGHAAFFTLAGGGLWLALAMKLSMKVMVSTGRQK